MKKYIHDRLVQLTDEEIQILNGINKVNKEIYTDKTQFIIDSNKLLNDGELIHIRKHTRFVDFPEHKHNYIEFNYVYKGKLIQKINNKKITLNQGELIFLNQHIVHEIEASKEKDIIINFIIKPEFFNYITSLIENDNAIINFLLTTLYTNYNEGQYLYFKVADNKDVQDIIEKIIIELYESDAISKAKTKLLVGLLLVELVKNSKDIEASSNNDYEKKMIVEVLKYIDENYKDASLEAISDVLNQNDYKVSKLLKKHVGYTFKELLQEKRLSKAIEFLSNTDLTIIEIIEAVGYENLTYFYKIFKSKYKMTPKEYKNRIGIN